MQEYSGDLDRLYIACPAIESYCQLLTGLSSGEENNSISASAPKSHLTISLTTTSIIKSLVGEAQVCLYVHIYMSADSSERRVAEQRENGSRDLVV